MFYFKRKSILTSREKSIEGHACNAGNVAENLLSRFLISYTFHLFVATLHSQTWKWKQSIQLLRWRLHSSTGLTCWKETKWIEHLLMPEICLFVKNVKNESVILSLIWKQWSNILDLVWILLTIWLVLVWIWLARIISEGVC